MNRRDLLKLVALAGSAVAPALHAEGHEFAFSWRSVPNQLVEIGIWHVRDGERVWVSTTLGKAYRLMSEYEVIDCSVTKAERAFSHTTRDETAKQRALDRLRLAIATGFAIPQYSDKWPYEELLP